MRTRIAAVAAVFVTALAGAGVWLVNPASAAPKRGLCASSTTNNIVSVALTSSGRCPKGFWGPVSAGAGAQGPQGIPGLPGPKGDKGDQGAPGKDGVLCTVGYAVKDVVVTVRVPALIAAEAAALADLDAAEATAVKTEKAAGDAQKAVDDAQGVLMKALAVEPVDGADVAAAQTKLAAAVSTRNAAVKADVDAKAAVVAKQKAYSDAMKAAETVSATIRTCVKG